MANNVPNDTEGGWSKWGNHVLIELQRLNSNLEKLQESVNVKITDVLVVVSDHKTEVNDKINKNDKEISVIKAKASAYGAMAGMAISFVFHYLLSKITKG